MIRSMPEHQGADVQQDRHLHKYDYISFMDKLIGEQAAASAQASAGAAPTALPVPGSPIKTNGLVRH